MKSIAQRLALAETMERELRLLHRAFEPLLAKAPAVEAPAGLVEAAKPALAAARRVLSREPGIGSLNMPRTPPTVADMALRLTLAHARLVEFRHRIEEIEAAFAAEEDEPESAEER